VKKENEALKDSLASLRKENRQLEQEYREMSDSLNELHKKVELNDHLGKRTVALGNRNEQYSRKLNIKFYGLPEKQGENVIETVNEALRQKTDESIDPTEVVAIHRIPGQMNQPQPILVKMKTADGKSRIMHSCFISSLRRFC
jgi:predicted nuclease with TOPRIM domain